MGSLVSVHAEMSTWYGYVRDKNTYQPIQGAKCTIIYCYNSSCVSGDVDYTSSSGYYSITDITVLPQSFSVYLKVEKSGYITKTVEVSIYGGQYNFLLRPYI